ncbi:MAG: VWA domain-containing protein, partial [Planctomycetaceae bacterium]|nr:VWA domain-containing protein [Planctomycetaceae bacterium]
MLQANGTTGSGSTAGDVLTTSVLEIDFPPETVPEGLLLAGFALTLALVTVFLWRDASRVGTWQRLWLLLLRLGALAVVLVIALNPHHRTQKESFRPSQVVLLIDTSTSMQQPAHDPTEPGSTADQELRWEAVKHLLADSPLLDQLREQHIVDVATFDSDLATGLVRLPKRDVDRTAVDGEALATPPDGPVQQTAPDWDQLLVPTGLSTRLGDSIDKLLAENRSQTLAGVVVISDGANNVGRDVTAANRRAQRDGVPLIAVGVGGAKPPVNLQLARLIVPTDVQLGDAFELTALLQASGLAEWLESQGRGTLALPVELLRRDPDTSEQVVVDSQDVTIREDGVPVEVTFSQAPAVAGELEYSI